jgi:hypothetical protein
MTFLLYVYVSAIITVEKFTFLIYATMLREIYLFYSSSAYISAIENIKSIKYQLE